MFGRRKIKELETKLASLEERVKTLENPSKTTRPPEADRSNEVNIGIIYDEWLEGERKGKNK